MSKKSVGIASIVVAVLVANVVLFLGFVGTKDGVQQGMILICFSMEAMVAFGFFLSWCFDLDYIIDFSKNKGEKDD